LGFSYVAATTQKPASHGSRDVTIGATGVPFPGSESLWGRQSVHGAPNGCGPPKSPNNVTSTFFNA